MQLSKRERNLIAIAVALLIFAIYYNIILMPSMENWQLLEQQIADATKELDEVAKVADIGAYKKILVNKGGIMGTYLDSPDILKHISAIAAVHEAVINSIVRSEAQGSADSEYSTVSFKMNISMPRLATVEFLQDIENNIPYVHIVKEVSINAAQQPESGLCDMSLTVDIYYSTKYGVNDGQ
ncbi:hypothetical protein [Mahella australiensis]|uniref:Uncharacterized protein n=1 Tax=Mahella australiensis (strain DSM 15567 / CIP 107919 / 50-1 BON) TaxID=697281 RepID=F4A393_MAHA5|nr:hypothetical protein [Mahella australiensis]AEE96326.1 hypothetical protein Mahau_1129 [Mahella australiensis 50-1 BON]